MRAHLEDLYSFYGDATGVRVARKHLSWYCRAHLSSDDSSVERLLHIETTQAQLTAVVELFDGHLIRAA